MGLLSGFVAKPDGNHFCKGVLCRRSGTCQGRFRELELDFTMQETSGAATTRIFRSAEFHFES
jgi:hypothetical protein